MANAKKVSPTVEVVLNEQTYKIKFGMKAIIALDEKYQINLMNPEHSQKLQMSPAMVAKVIWAGMQRHHPDLTLDNVADILDDSENAEIERALSQAFSSAMEDDVKKNQQKEGEKGKEAKA